MSISHLLLGVENTLTKSNIPSSLPPDEDVVMPKAARIPAEAELTPVRRAKLLERVAAFYHLLMAIGKYTSGGGAVYRRMLRRRWCRGLGSGGFVYRHFRSGGRAVSWRCSHSR
jgi:hypothetical protein